MNGLLSVTLCAVHGSEAVPDSRNCQTLRVPRQSRGITLSFTAETIAIDVTNALRAADSGLRGFRSRSLLRRLWHDLTGTSQELQSAISSDLVTVQRGTLKLVKEIMREETR